MPHRIIGIIADIDDEHVVPGPSMTVYSSIEEGPIFGGRLFVHTGANPYTLVTPITRIIRNCPPTSPWNVPLHWKTFGPKCSLRTSQLVVFGGFAPSPWPLLRRRCRRAGVLRQRPHARIRYSSCDWLATSSSLWQESSPRAR